LYGFYECVNLDFGKSKGEFREVYVKERKRNEKKNREGEIEN
jgi:hypothetical protein